MVMDRHQRRGPPSEPSEHPPDLKFVADMDVFTILARRMHEMSAGLIRLLPQFGIALLVLLLTYAASKFARRIAEKRLSLPVR